MKRAWAVMLVVGVGLPAAGCSEGEEPANEQASYALGVNIGNDLKQLQADLDFDELVEGLSDALNDREPEMTPQEIQATLSEFFAKVQEEGTRRTAETAARNLEEGTAFLAENKTKEGVVETASGLQYMVLEQGDGPSPAASDQVTVHYEGKLLDGTVFDSSYERNEPYTTGLSSVIPGWSEGVQLMSVGSKFRFFLPANLAYGERGAGQDIGPNATLIFDVELLEIVQ